LHRPSPTAGSCAGGSNTGQQLSYDAEGRLVGWQNAPSSNSNAQASSTLDGESGSGHPVQTVIARDSAAGIYFTKVSAATDAARRAQAQPANQIERGAR
jgi:hypothetical protein